MFSEHIYTDCDFVNRLVFLCSQNGIKYKDIKNLPRVLSEELVNSGIVPLIAGTKEDLIENTRQKISRDIKNGSPLKVEFLDWYCRFFNCSADYLMGYIDTPTYEEKGIQELTGLNGSASRSLLKKDYTVITSLNVLLTGLDNPDVNDSLSASSAKRSLLKNLRTYLTDSGTIASLFSTSGDEIKADTVIIAKSENQNICGFAVDQFPEITMLRIQELLKEIRDDIQENNV